MSYQKLQNKTELDVLDHEGNVIERREFKNTPLIELYPEQDVAIIDWLGSTRERPETEDLDEPINGYMANCYWGSAVKGGATIGVTQAFLDGTMVKHAEDGQRVGRYLLAQGHWGGVKGSLRIKVVPRGTMTEHGLVEDGFGYIDRRVVDEGYSGLDKIGLGKAKESYTFWQRVPWSEELEREISPIIYNTLVDVSDLSNVLMKYYPGTFDEKKEMAALDEQMIEHPFIANALERSSGEFFSRIATTVQVGSRIGIAVPTVGKVVIPGHDGKAVIYRYPIDSFGSIQAVEVDEEEADRVASLEVVQYSLSSHTFFAKGCSGIVDMDDYDMIICADDIKMANGELKDVRRRNSVEFDGALVFTQYYKAGSAIGVNAAWAKDLMGLDHDGDMVSWIDTNELPVLHDAVSNFPTSETPKLKKSKSDLGHRSGMIRKSMMNLVGFASNLAADTFTVSDREYLAGQLGFKSEHTMDTKLNFNIKVGTDGFKTLIDQEPVRRHMSIMQTNINKIFGHGAIYSSWPNDTAFKHFVPSVFDENLPDEEKGSSIKPWMDGTVPNICRMTLPSLKDILGEPIRVRPLTEYRHWAIKPDKLLFERARVALDWYNAKIAKVNWQDTKEITKFKSDWVDYLTEWIEKANIDRWMAANAIWSVAHSARSNSAGAGSVFLGFIDECLRIIEEKPGHNGNGFQTVLVGLGWQLPDVDDLVTDVEIVDVEVDNGKRSLVRKAVVARVEGQVQPKDTRYPANMIAMVAKNANQPEVGHYQANICKFSDNAHSATLN